MRVWATAILLGLGACQQAPKVAPAPAEITFDGAQVRSAAARIAHGERLSWTLGCRGCHGPELRGHYFYERYASNLTRELPKYSDAEIERVLRTGVPRDGRELWGMPSELFQHLSDTDMKELIADLRTLKTGGTPTQPAKPWQADAVEMIKKGELKTAAAFVRDEKAKAPLDLGPRYAQGRYITMVTCAECHGPKLEGADTGKPPNLVVAGGYSRAEFERLLTRGIPTGGRKLDLMAEVARERFAKFTPHERDALYAYLKARAEHS